MNKDSGSSSSSRKGDEVELVSRFLAPLCARDETARNLALAAARSTVEGWLGGVGSPSSSNNNDHNSNSRSSNSSHNTNNNHNNTSSTNNNRWELAQPEEHSFARSAGSPLKAGVKPGYWLQPRDGLAGDAFLCQQAVCEGAGQVFVREASLESAAGGPTPAERPIGPGSFDCVDGKPGGEANPEPPSHWPAKEPESHSGSSCEGGPHETAGRHYPRPRAGRQKQFAEEDELDADTRAYGKSPKFDENFGGLELRGRRHRDAPTEDWHGEAAAGPTDAERVVFNTLDGFLNGAPGPGSPDEPRQSAAAAAAAGQIKRPLSRDEEELPWRSGRPLLRQQQHQHPAEVVTPGDVGRMLNLGNALDGPRQAHANKYLSLVSLHLPVILRLSVNCPFRNVRTKCAEIVQMIKDRGLPVPEPAYDGPSAFVPVSE